MGALAIPLLVAVLLTGSCAAAVPATCDDSVWNPPPELSCDEAITAARAQYATTPGITGLTVQYGGICPPGAHCQIPRGNQATVGASIAGGVQLYVTVTVGEDGIVRADAPQPVPTPLP
jgi:hypothetical protein